MVSSSSPWVRFFPASPLDFLCRWGLAPWLADLCSGLAAELFFGLLGPWPGPGPGPPSNCSLTGAPPDPLAIIVPLGACWSELVPFEGNSEFNGPFGAPPIAELFRLSPSAPTSVRSFSPPIKALASPEILVRAGPPPLGPPPRPRLSPRSFSLSLSPANSGSKLKSKMISPNLNQESKGNEMLHSRTIGENLQHETHPIEVSHTIFKIYTSLRLSSYSPHQEQTHSPKFYSNFI